MVACIDENTYGGPDRYSCSLAGLSVAWKAKMANKTEQRIYRLFAACSFLVVASFIVPRFVSNPEAGFAAGASAVLAFLAILFTTFLLAIYLAVITAKSHNSVSTLARFAGFSPAILLAATLLGLFVFLSF